MAFISTSGRRSAELCIAVRCHQYPIFVVDTLDSVFYYSVTYPHVVVCIDYGEEQQEIEKAIRKAFPQVLIYKSPVRYCWGPGMYCLLCDTLQWAEENLSFKHFMSLDYDAIFTKEGADAKHIESITSDAIGLVATDNGPSRHWMITFESKMSKIKQLTDGKMPSDTIWRPGDSSLGSIMLLTRPCINTMKELGYFRGKYRDIRDSLILSDDVWLRFLVALSGFCIASNNEYVYNVWQEPEMYTEVTKRKTIYAWHPTKMQPGGRKQAEYEIEKTCRNWFRERREKSPL